jgi:DNA (cytosine-5)-methyltransferase 1
MTITKHRKDTKLPGKGIRVAAFFAGAGGLDLGFDQAGFDIVYATDIDESCCKTLKENSGKGLASTPEILQADITKLRPMDLPRNIDLVIGGPPCQSFSASGRRAGGAAGRLDRRGNLFESYCKILDYLQPRAFFFENVRGILGTNKGQDWHAILASFKALGYDVSFRILDALDYGVPQQRERLFLVGHKLKSPFLFPEPVFGPDSAEGVPHVTTKQAFGGVDNSAEDLKSLYLRDGKYSHLLPLLPPGANYLHFTAKRGYPKPIFAYRSRFSDFLYKANPDSAIKTLIARPGKYTGPLHWENRYFTIAEYKRLQGFPDEYVFVGGRDEAIKQIGNSVSPKVAYHLALAIARQVFKRNVDVALLAEDATLSFDRRKGLKAQSTRAFHDKVREKTGGRRPTVFRFTNYKTRVTPTSLPLESQNTLVSVNGNHSTIVVRSDNSRRRFAKVRIEIRATQRTLFKELNEPDAKLEVIAYGEAEHTIQTLWNAVDDWVIRSSQFHSLFELYGHFTEPHPIIEVTEFRIFSSQPIARFAKHCADFSNCSRLFPRSHLTGLFGVAFKKANFVELVKTLRQYRYDIRCMETNVTMAPDKYMVAYPFTLPNRKQMNFTVRQPRKPYDKDPTRIAA